MTTLTGPFKAARRVSTPLIAITTPDPAEAIQSLFNGLDDHLTAFLQWDCVQGLLGLNEAGNAVLAGFGADPAVSRNLVETLAFAARMPERTILFVHNAHRFIDQPVVAQAVWNLRDGFKSSQRTLVLLCPHILLPAELAQDVWLIEEPLPGLEALEAIVRAQYGYAQVAVTLAELTEETVRQAVDALVGLAAFPAEQAVAMSLSPQGLDIAALWERKRQRIAQTPGLAVWRGGETFEQIGGVENAKTFLTRLVNGRQPPRAVVYMDEIEKALAGAGSDSSGVSQSFLGTLLAWMQDQEAQGCLFLGPPGAAKSAVAKAVGNTAGIPTISFDLGGMKASLVGESESRLRTALNVIQAVSQGRALFVATCNSLQALAPEIRRRFKEGTLFFDLPDRTERQMIWDIYLTQYGFTEPTRLPDDTGWTGAEIKQCCDLAYKLDCTLLEAASYVVPISRSAADQIEMLRQQAHGRFVSASYPGLYDRNRNTTAQAGGRAFTQE